MLKFLRGRKRSRNVLLLVFVGILTLSLVGLFSVVVSGGGAGLFRGTGGSDSAVAKVADYEVTVKELRDALNRFGQQMAQGQGKAQGQDAATVYSLYGTQILNNLVRQKIVIYEANRLNFEASDSQVQTRLRQTFSPWPGAEAYRMRLQQFGLTPVAFEDQLRAAIAEEHLKSYITAGIQVTPEEIERDYLRSNLSITVRWVEVAPDPSRDKTTISEPELRAYFDSHRGEFRIATEQRKARYIFLDQDKAGEAIQISDDELRADFNPERSVKQVRVSQIVFNVPKPEAPAKPAAAGSGTSDANQAPTPEEEIRKKAQDIFQRAQGAEGKPAEDFAKLARQYSQDPKSKSKGGDLGWVNKGDKRESDDPVNRALGMKINEVTQPIKKGDKYYILKVTERKVPTFEETRADLLKSARSKKGYSKAVELATQAEQKFKETRDAQAVVDEINKASGAEVAAIRETPFFSQGDTLPELGSGSALESALFGLENINDVADRVNITKGLAVVQYADRREPHDAELDEVREKVEQSFRADKARQLAAERARKLAQAGSADELKKIADSMGVKVDERAGLGANDSVGPLVSEADREPLYELNQGDITREPIKVEGSESLVVAALIARKDVDMGAPFLKERPSIEQRLLDEKRNVYYSSYLDMTEKQLREAGEIEIFHDVIASALGQPAAPESPSPGSVPGRPLRPGRPVMPAAPPRP